jgi:hypothetical protein
MSSLCHKLSQTFNPNSFTLEKGWRRGEFNTASLCPRGVGSPQRQSVSTPAWLCELRWRPSKAGPTTGLQCPRGGIAAGFHCRHEGGCRGHREAESSFQGGWGHVDKHAIGDGLCAGVTKDDLSEKAPGVLCFGGFKVAHAILNSAKRRQAFCVPEGWRGQGRALARRNGINREAPLAGSRRFMPDSLYPWVPLTKRKKSYISASENHARVEIRCSTGNE